MFEIFFALFDPVTVTEEVSNVCRSFYTCSAHDPTSDIFITEGCSAGWKIGTSCIQIPTCMPCAILDLIRSGF